jgi:hypothetical protein
MRIPLAGTLAATVMLVLELGAAPAKREAPKSMTLAVRKPYPMVSLSVESFAGEPDATITVKQSSEGYLFGHVDSDGTTYNSDGSKYFVVDVTIPANFKFEGGWPPAIIIYGQLHDWASLANTEATCPKSSISWALYKKGVNLQRQVTWTKVVSEKKVGHWEPSPDLGVPAYCDSGLSKPFNIPTPASKNGKSVTYRVMVLPKLNGAVKKATVGWHWHQ